MEDDFLDPASSSAYLSAWKIRIDRAAAETQTVSDRLADLRVTAGDPNDLTEVTVDAAGALIGIRFTERIRHAGPDAVARAVMTALRDARHEVAEIGQEIVTSVLGADSVAARAIAERICRLTEGEA